MKKVLIDLLGERFGNLRVAARGANRGTAAYWVCQCSCGRTVEVAAGNLRSGKSTTCGCSRTKHGQWRTKEYVAWRAMWQRCGNPKSAAFHNYGGRGITVCDSWNDYKVFRADMGKCPAGRSLERKNNEGHYNRANCVWATQAEQGRNRRTTMLTRAEVFAILASLEPQKVLAKQYGVSQATISRVKNGVCWA